MSSIPRPLTVKLMVLAMLVHSCKTRVSLKKVENSTTEDLNIVYKNQYLYMFVLCDIIELSNERCIIYEINE